MRLPPFHIDRVVTAPNGKHYRVRIHCLPCPTGCTDIGLHVHLVGGLIDPLPITHLGMVTWDGRRRRHRRAR